MNIEIEVRTLPTAQQPLGTLLTTIDMPDLVEESFRMHISLCDDEYFHFGGCVAAWIKFTTTKLTYGNNTPIRWDRVGMFVRTYTVDENDNRTYTLLGTFYGKEYTETVNHTRVDVTAYDPMYLIATCDLTKWYNEFVPSAQENFILQFMTRAYDEVLSKTPVYAETVGGVDVDESEAFTEAFGNIQWKRTVVIDGREEPLMSGTITYGKLLKDFCIACGYNATLDVKPTGYAVLHYRNVTAAKTPIAIAPTDYRDLEYSSFDTDAFTNVRIKAYNSMFDATNTETLTYGILNNWITNVGTQYSGADQTQAETLLTMLQRMIYRPCSFTTFERKCNIGDYVDITDTNGNVYHAIVMQEDISGIVGASFTYTCLATGDYYKETGTVDYYNDNLFSIDDTYPTVTEAATRTNLSIGDTMKTIIGKIKKFFADLKTVAFTGSYNDLTDKPTNATASADGFMSSTDFKKINPQEIPNNTDLNTITNIGLYYKANISTLTNCPTTNNYCALIVNATGSSTRRSQIYIQGGSYNRIYFRIQTAANTWAAWEQVARVSDLPTKLSDLTDDVVSGHYLPMSTSAALDVANTNAGQYAVILFKSGATNGRAVIGFKDKNGTTLGYLGVNENKKPIFLNGAAGSTDKEIALAENVVKLSSSATQTIANTQTTTSTALAVKSALTNCFMEYIDGNGAGLGYFGVMASKTPVYVPFGSSLRGQISVVGRNAAHIYTASSSSSYAKIKINSTAAWMLSFRVRAYSSYTTDEYIIGGYNYATTGKWYSPTAILVNSSGSAKKVIFGYDGNNDLWVAVPVGTYRACDVVDVVNASTQLDTSDLFSITWVDEANLSTVQVETTVSPLAKKSDIPSSLNCLPLAGGQMTGAITFAQGSIVQQTANTMPFFLGIDAFASGGAMKWQTTAGVVNALNSGTSGLVKKTTNIQSGTVNVSANTTKAVSFATAFGGTPIIVANVYGTNNGYVCINNRTASGFDVKCNIAATVGWIAYYTG